MIWICNALQIERTEKKIPINGKDTFQSDKKNYDFDKCIFWL